jgi:hypothetical protein
MNTRMFISFLAASVVLAGSLRASALDTLHSTCVISPSEHAGKFRLKIDQEQCDDGGDHCGQFNDDSVTRLSGISITDLSRDGAQLTGRIEGEAGTFTCTGTVHDSELRGDSTFTPNEEFVSRMGQMGFEGFTSEKLQAYTLFDIQTAWVRALQHAGVGGISTDNLIALRIFRIDPDYVSGFSSLGYGVPEAEKLIALKVQGVNAQEVRQIRDLGYQPSLDEMIQISIFHITPEFIRSMQARGFHDLTIAKLVQMKIFKLDD